VPDVAGVLLNQVEQDALEGRGWRTLPALARSSDVRQLVGLHHQAATRTLRLKGLHEVGQALIAGDVPTLVPVINSGSSYGTRSDSGGVTDPA